MIPLMKNAFTHEVETKKALADFIVSTEKLSMGSKCYEFECNFSSVQGRNEGILFNSGGSANLALLQSLRNLGRINVGSKIGFTALTWSTNVMPIIQLGMIPVAIDCNTSTLNVMSSNLLKSLEETSIDVLFITNVLGFSGDLAEIKDICKSKNIILIEDNCEALGTVLSEGRTGNFGVASTFSFFVAHHMSTIEGGMVCTDDEELAEMLKIVRSNGWDRNLKAEQQLKLRKKNDVSTEFQAKYTFYDLGFNLRPTEITGFIGLEQLKYLDENISKRNSNHLRISNEIDKNPDLINVDYTHIQFLSPFAVPIVCKTKELKSYYCEQFAGAGIEIRPMISGNIQLQPFYSKYVEEMQPCPGADFLHQNSFYCGNYPELNSMDIELIRSCLQKY